MRYMAVLLLLAVPLKAVGAGEFASAGWSAAGEATLASIGAAKMAGPSAEGTRNAVVLFGRLSDQTSDWNVVPEWGVDVFDPKRAGSLSHFYDTMSFGELRLRGEAGTRVYTSTRPGVAYLAANEGEPSRYGELSLEIVRQADGDIDFSSFDNDGPDGTPDSGDDDGFVDALFVVMPAVPADLIIGEATGVSGLGFSEVFETDDLGANGTPILVDPHLGSLQQGRSFAEAVGAMAHEYGHILGLPDLYNAEIAQQTDPDPREDSAGIGRWGLMGWGATGWRGNDGPTCFCAWSRMRLGWAEVRVISYTQEEMRLEEVGLAGALYLIPVDLGEFFLLEHRRRGSTYYDRNMPGDGLLIWHVKDHMHGSHPDQATISEIEGAFQVPATIDLECADGRWAEAGYPLGSQADVREGGDNLDSWAHDSEYAQGHGGNLGDATDLYDGVRYRAFTPDTNPGSLSTSGSRGVRIEEIRFEDGVAMADASVLPAEVVVSEVDLMDEHKDGVLSAGEEGRLRVRLHNQGGFRSEDLRIVLTSDDPLIEILQSEARLGALRVGHYSGAPTNEEGFPRVRLSPGLEERCEVQLDLGVYAGDSRIANHSISIEAMYSHRLVVRITDAGRNGIAGVPVAITRVDPKTPQFWRVETDADGVCQFGLVPGDYRLQLKSLLPGESGPRLMAFQLTGDMELDIQSLPFVFVSGVVRGPGGDPVANCSVRVTDAGTGFQGHATADAEGVFRLDLPPGNYRFEISAWSGIATQALQDIHVDGDRVLDIHLQAGVQVRLEIVDDLGKGIPAGNLMFLGDSNSLAYADSDGVAVTELVPGVYGIDFLDLPHQFVDPEPRLYQVASDTTLRLRFVRGIDLAGHVSDESVVPYFDPSLRLIPLDGARNHHVEIERDGTFSARLPPGRYVPVFSGVESRRSLVQVLPMVTVLHEEALGLVVESGMEAQGRILAKDGTGLVDAVVSALSEGAGVRASARVGIDGAFELPLRPGAYEFIVAHGGQYTNLGMVEIPTRDELIFQLSERVLLRGRVTDGAGRPASGALVVVSRDVPAIMGRAQTGFGALAAVHTGKHGGFQVEVPAGPHTIVSLPEEQVGIGCVVHGAVAGGAEEVELVWADEGDLNEVQGQIYDEPDIPRGQLVLQFHEDGGSLLAQAACGDNRHYVVELPDGLYRVRVALEGPAGGVLRTYEAGPMAVTSDLSWDIHLMDASTQVDYGGAAVPRAIYLGPNFPNPFNASTVIQYRLAATADVELSVYNLLGQRVRHLVHREEQAGEHRVEWHGRDDNGRALASGVYLYRLRTADEMHAQTRKLLLLR